MLLLGGTSSSRKPHKWRNKSFDPRRARRRDRKQGDLLWWLKSRALLRKRGNPIPALAIVGLGMLAGRTLIQEKMCTELVVIASVGSKDSTQVGVAEDEDVIVAFPADRAD
jgi:hypothetical protein